MHGSFDRSGQSGDRTQRSWSIGFFAFPILLVIALIGLTLEKLVFERLEQFTVVRWGMMTS